MSFDDEGVVGTGARSSEIETWLDSNKLGALKHVMVQHGWDDIEMLLELDVNSDGLDGLINDIEKGVQLSNSQKIKLKMAIKKLQKSQTIASNTNNNSNNISNNSNGNSLIVTISKEEVEALSQLKNHIESMTDDYNLFMQESKQCEDTYLNQVKTQFEQIYLNLKKYETSMMLKLGKRAKHEQETISNHLAHISKNLEEARQLSRDCNSKVKSGIDILDLSSRQTDIIDGISVFLSQSDAINSQTKKFNTLKQENIAQYGGFPGFNSNYFSLNANNQRQSVLNALGNINKFIIKPDIRANIGITDGLTITRITGGTIMVAKKHNYYEVQNVEKIRILFKNLLVTKNNATHKQVKVGDRTENRYFYDINVKCSVDYCDNEETNFINSSVSSLQQKHYAVFPDSSTAAVLTSFKSRSRSLFDFLKPSGLEIDATNGILDINKINGLFRNSKIDLNSKIKLRIQIRNGKDFSIPYSDPVIMKLSFQQMDA